MIQSHPSQNALANQQPLAPFSSWNGSQPPAGYFCKMTAEAGHFYQDHGFLVLLEAASQVEVDALNAEATQICRGRRGVVRGIATDTESETDLEVMRRYLCIHYPHKVSQVMLETIAHPVAVEVLTQVIGPNVKCMQSMLFIKASGKPGQAWHQDEDFIPTRDRSLTGAWMALDDATVQNGCLWVIPGSHKHGVLWPMVVQNDARFDCTNESQFFPYSDDDAVAVEVPAGSIVFFNGYLLHRSLPNFAPTGFRRSLVNHYMSAESLLPWHSFEAGQSIAVADYRDVVMVSGYDPYGWKGIENIAVSHIRPSGEGGCGDAQKHNVEQPLGENIGVTIDDDDNH